MGQIQNRLTELAAIKARQENRTISYRDIAQETGIALGTVSSWANNRITRYDAPVLLALCEWLGCSISDLLIITDDDDGSVTPRRIAEGLITQSAAILEDSPAL